MPGRLLSIDASPPHAYGFGGIVAEGGVDAELVPSVLGFLARERRLRLSIRPNPLQHEAWYAAAEGWPTTGRSAHVLDLAGGADEIWSRMHQHARRNIHLEGPRQGLPAGTRLGSQHGGDLVSVLEQPAIQRRAGRKGTRRQAEPCRARHSTFRRGQSNRSTGQAAP